MATFTTAVAGRNPERSPHNHAEAVEMLSTGFRFAEFNPEGGSYRASVPYRVARNLLEDILTIEQR